MTVPIERYYAISNTRQFLIDLCDPKKTKVSTEIRRMARSLLKHYPTEYELDEITEQSEVISKTWA
jgi:hypothetical protein